MTFSKGEESDEEIPDLEVVPKDDLVDLTRLSQSAPAVPKGFRRVEIEVGTGQSEDEDDPFDDDELNMEDLPDLELAHGDTAESAPGNPEEPTSMVLGAAKPEGKSVFEIVQEKPKSDLEEMLFTKVSDQSDADKPSETQPKKILIEEIENDDIL